MIYQTIQKSLISRYLPVFLVVCGFLLAAFTQTQAQTSTFAQFVQRTGTNRFVFNNNSTNANFTTVSGGATIFFFYDDERISGLPEELTGAQSARLTISSTTTAPSVVNSQDIDQPFNATVIIQILRDTAATVGSGSRRNLLTIYINQATDRAAISGTLNGQSGEFSATTPDHSVFFTSDFLNFNTTTSRNMALSFSSVISSLSVGSGDFLNSFTAAGTGTFASNPIPTFGVPTSASFEVRGRVLSSEGSGVNKARVYLTDANGNTKITRTNNFGYFRFEDVSTGQALVYVESKGAGYAPQSFNLSGALDNLVFVPEQ